MSKQQKKTSEKRSYRERTSLSSEPSQPLQSLQHSQPSQPSQSSQPSQHSQSSQLSQPSQSPRVSTPSSEVQETRPRLQRSLTPAIESPTSPISARQLIERRPSIQLPSRLAWEADHISALEEGTKLNYSRIIKSHLY